MTKKNLYTHILLDRSGSMESNREITVDAFNEYVNGLRVAKDIDVRLSLTLFDSGGIDLVHDTLPVSDFPELSSRDYQPRAMTPLLDAIGQTMARIGAVTLRADEKITFVIFTDGLENASQEFKLADIRALITRRQNEDDWQILFLGANIDAIQEGLSLGVAAAQSLKLDAKRMHASLASVQAAQSYHAQRAPNAEKYAFTAKDRSDAEG
jgi:hypothetical protein